MFRKIVSNLNFSPALVGQLGFYAKRLRKEEATRRLGLIFTALALAVQSLAIFAPPEAANAASSADFVRGGVSSPAQYLKYYDRNSNNIKDIYSSLGITRSEIAHTKKTTIREPGHYNWSLTSLYSHAQGQRAWTFKKAHGGKKTVYYRPMQLTQEGGPVHTVFVGHSKIFGWFAIKKDCGNLITKTRPRAPNPTAVCQVMRVSQIDATRYRIATNASKKDGAAIKGYRYHITRNGKTVATRTFSTAALSHHFVYTQTTPGRYVAKSTVLSSVGAKTNRNCQDTFVIATKPAAVCQNVTAEISDRTIVALGGSARTANGATITRYTFSVRNSSGNEIKHIVVTSHKSQVDAENFTVAEPGEYTVLLTVDTSVGQKTGPDCTKKFTIVKPEVCQYNPTLPANSPDCQPCAENPEIWIKDTDCSPDVISSKTATNMTQGNVQASTVTAKAGDKISYTLSVNNRGFASENVTMKESLTDVLEYAKLVDMGGGSYDTDTQTLSWPSVSLASGQKQSRTIAVQLLSPLPATNTGTSNESSYDCVMTNTFGNSVSVNVDCAQQKVVVEQVVKELPHTGARENMIFAGALLAVVVYFYARSRQLGKEVRLVRRSLNSGTI